MPLPEYYYHISLSLSFLKYIVQDIVLILKFFIVISFVGIFGNIKLASK